VNQTINGSGAGNGLVGTTTTVVIQPFTTTTGADNPKYTATCLITQWPQVYNVGELATISVTWPVSGAVVKTIV